MPQIASSRFDVSSQEFHPVAVTMAPTAALESKPEAETSATRPGKWLVAWLVILVAIHAVVWVAGLPDTTIEVAVDEGAAKAESWGVGETGDDVVRKAIRLQNETLPFWKTIALLRDFLADPLALIVRAASVTVLFSGLAALTGRPVGFGAAFRDNVRAQGLWVLGAGVSAALMIALRRPEVETGLTLFLPSGHYDAATWVALSKIDVFALIGWTLMALGGWRRGQVNLALAGLICGMLALLECVARIALALTIGASMRLTLMPDFPL